MPCTYMTTGMSVSCFWENIKGGNDERNDGFNRHHKNYNIKDDNKKYRPVALQRELFICELTASPPLALHLHVYRTHIINQ
jgi:hypothetical protein